MVKPEDLTREKSLLAIYLLARKFPHSKFNRRVAIFVAFLLCAYGYIQWNRSPELLVVLRHTVELGTNLAAPILGFLIAGFTVFVTVTKIDIFVAMAKVNYEGTDESYLKYNLVQFMLVFCHYIAYLFFCVLFALLASPGGFMSLLLLSVPSIGGYALDVHRVYQWATVVGFVLFGTWTVYLVLLLKSFVFNTFQVITTAVRWELQEKDK